jgi:hypothetical protein
MHTMHLLPAVAIQPNLELKTQPKQLLGSLPLVTALPDLSYEFLCVMRSCNVSISKNCASISKKTALALYI